MNRNLTMAVVLLIAADWLSKLWVTSRLALGESLALVDGWLYFVHRQNPGVAFSLLADLPGQWRAPLLSAVSAVGVYLFGRIVISATDVWLRIAAAVVLGGAIGNLGDRLVNGHVTDFVLVSFFPFVFNLADAAITVGGILLALRLLLSEASLEPVTVTDTE